MLAAGLVQVCVDFGLRARARDPTANCEAAERPIYRVKVVSLLQRSTVRTCTWVPSSKCYVVLLRPTYYIVLCMWSQSLFSPGHA
jgi:hypothetical protein|eukprot:COSAG06_NODE_5556_length_3404_cov_1.955825_4_plen_85_part_00